MKKVMIVDDNILSVEGIVKNIDWSSLNAIVTHVAYNGESAIELMKKEHVDLIITDIEMPDIDGISMSSIALTINPLVRVILISAYDKFEYAKRAIRLGVCDYIEKPIDYQYLSDKIKNAFLSIEREINTKALLEQSRPIMTEKFFTDLLTFSGSDASIHLHPYAKFLNLNLEYNFYNVIKIKVENYAEIERNIGFTQYQIELLNSMELLQEYFKLFDYTYFIRESNGFICILGQNTKSQTHFTQVIHKQLTAYMDKISDAVLKMHIGIGTIVDTIWSVNISYENALNALKYHFFSPHQTIFDAKEVFGHEFSLLSFTDNQEEELIRLLCQKDLQKIDLWLKDFFQNLSQKCPAKNLIFIRVYSLLGRILKFLYEIDIDSTELEEQIISAYNHFEIFHTYEQFYEWMYSLCLTVCQKLDSSLSSYHNQLCELVTGYIKENFEDSTLCLNDIAHYANVSPAYLSALYKKIQNQSISDTITTFRIEKACYYLQQTNISLKEISILCGYANQYYFSNSFKKKMGTSPSRFREKIQL